MLKKLGHKSKKYTGNVDNYIDNQQHLAGEFMTKVLLTLLMVTNARLYFITMPRTLQRCKWSFLVLLL